MYNTESMISCLLLVRFLFLVCIYLAAIWADVNKSNAEVLIKNLSWYAMFRTTSTRA